MSITAKLVLLILVFITGMGVGVKWQLGVHARAEIERESENRKQERENRQAEREDANNTIGAINAATKRATQNAAAAADARSELGRLHDDIADLQRRNSTGTVEACRNHAAALSSVFDQCAATLEGLAGKADGHANDSLMFEQALPKPKD